VTRRARLARRAAVVTLVTAVVTAAPASAGASLWRAGLAAGSHGQARAGSIAPPSDLPVGTCVTGTTTVKVTWTAAPPATSYDVLQATDSTPFSVVATGRTGTSWTTGALPTGFNYYFEIVSVKGSWSSAPSAASSRRYISGSGGCS
jgi:hypothetical protein